MSVCEHCGASVPDSTLVQATQALRAFTTQQRATYEHQTTRALPAVLCAGCCCETIGAVNGALTGNKV